VKPGANDPGIIKYNQVIVSHERGKITELSMADRSAGAVDDHHPGGLPPLEWARGNQCPGQMVIEVVSTQVVAGHRMGNPARKKIARKSIQTC
jgi:hypothetical protein